MDIILIDRDEWLKELSFLEAKNIKGIEEKIDLPVYTPHLIEWMKKGEEIIPTNLFLEGMLILLAADPNFVYKDQYLEILENEEMKNILLEQGKDRFFQKDSLTLPYVLGLYRFIERDEINLMLAILYEEKQLNNTADFLIQNMENENSDSIFVNTLLSIFYHSRKETEKSLRALEKIKDKAPLNEEQEELFKYLKTKSYEEKISEYLNKEDFNIVIKLIDEISEEELSGKLCHYKGMAEQGLGLFAPAIRSLEKALEMNTVDREIFNDLSISYYLIGDIEKAIIKIEEGLKLYPDDERMLYNIFIYYTQLDQTEKAKDILKKLKSMEIVNEQIKLDLEML